MNLGLEDKVAIVTGASQGIGKAITNGLVQEGVKVAICSRHQTVLEETATQITSSNETEVFPVRADLTKKKDIQSLIKKTLKKFNRIDILVNNTGGPSPKIFMDTREDDWYKALNQLLMSMINCCREVLPYMMAQRWGRIINMTSFTAKQPTRNLVLSNSIRSGILGLTKTLSNELADYGILVNAVCPGWTRTRRVEELAKTVAKERRVSYKKVLTEWANTIPLKRLAFPEEIANVVVFLASQKASYLTGSVLQVDGGFIKSTF